MKNIMIFLLGLFILSSCSNKDDIVEDTHPIYNNKLNLPDHPRLLFSLEEEANILELAKSEPILSDLIEILRDKANKLLTSPLLKPASDGTIIDLDQSRDALYRIITLSMAYRLFDEDKYASRVERELLNVCSFSSWNTYHFLDVAEMTNAVAIGYDWCFDYLPDSSKLTIEKAIKRLAIKHALTTYQNGDDGSWAKRMTNWNSVCNSGMVSGAIAVGDVYPDDAQKVIDYAIQFVPNNLANYAPNGVYYEGPVYWGYSLIYFSMLSNNLTRNFNSDSGLSNMSGVSEACHFYRDITSPSKRVFNFADSGGGDKALLTPVYFFFSKRYNQPEIADFFRNYLKEIIDVYKETGKYNFKTTFFLCIPWFDNTVNTTTATNEKLKILKGVPDILVFNGDKEDPDELFLAAKGGDPDMTHNQLDVGSFIVECEQVKWGIDLGAADYNLPSIWDYDPNGLRWKYFRNSNLGHNTLNINGEIAYSGGEGHLSFGSADSGQPFGVYDMSSCYSQQAQSVKRGFKMMSPNVMLIQDEITSKNTSSTNYWRFLTKANVEFKDNYAKLSQDGKNFYVYSLSGDQSVMKTLVAQPNSSSEKPINGVTIIEISIKPDENRNAVIPVLLGKDLTEIINFKDQVNIKLADWE